MGQLLLRTGRRGERAKGREGEKVVRHHFPDFLFNVNGCFIFIVFCCYFVTFVWLYLHAFARLRLQKVAAKAAAVVEVTAAVG